ncbi:MAG: transaldolase [Aggregatilineales bacterium]
MTKLHALNQLGQAVWLDFISRDLIESGELADLIQQGLRGMTSNPSIFEKSISNGEAYDEQLNALKDEHKTPIEIYEAIAIQDIQSAADLFRQLYDETNGADGFVSLEVNPNLSRDTQGTIDEVHRLRERVNRPNVMFKVPATNEGIIAVRRLVSEGINVNITLMFSLSHYNAVAQAYIDGLETYYEAGGDMSRVASVASFFVSRVDAKLDPILEKKGAEYLKGKIAIANAKQVYKRFNEMFSGGRWEKLANAGARVQRPLWASTSTKDPSYPDTLYVDNLIGANTVNTMPPDTLDAFLDHGNVQETVNQGVDEADTHLVELVKHDINLLKIGDELQEEGVEKFMMPFDALMNTIAKESQHVV